MRQRLQNLLPTVRYEIWILAIGRLISQTGTGFILFYAPIYFTQNVGLSATEVGLGIGCKALSGIFGRIAGGTLADLQSWGRRRTILLSSFISASGALALANCHDFSTFVTASLIMGVGIGLFWPAAEALIADLTEPSQRNEAYALNRLGDMVGLGTGVILGGLLIRFNQAYQLLFIIDAISYLVFFVVVYAGIKIAERTALEKRVGIQQWQQALNDRRLRLFIAVNVIFIVYISQVSSTLPNYFGNFLPTGDGQVGFQSMAITVLFTWHTLLNGILQMPVSRLLNRWGFIKSFIISNCLWSFGFFLIWMVHNINDGQTAIAGLALTAFSFAIVIYLPAASSFVVHLAPDSMRGVYLSINSLCWAVGFLFGPSFGGFALDHGGAIQIFWLSLTASVILMGAILARLRTVTQSSVIEAEAG
jgi:MFS family permease